MRRLILISSMYAFNKEMGISLSLLLLMQKQKDYCHTYFHLSSNTNHFVASTNTDTKILGSLHIPCL